MNRRLVRMACKMSLLVSLPVTGFAWALTSDPRMIPVALALTAFSIASGFCAEHHASSSEHDLRDVSEMLRDAERRHADEIARRDEQLRQQDRIISVLSAQDHDLRAKLISLHAKLRHHEKEGDQ